MMMRLRERQREASSSVEAFMDVKIRRLPYIVTTERRGKVDESVMNTG